MMTQPYIIGITGGSGSGKTSFIKQLQKRFDPGEICIISQDDYYRPLSEQVVDGEGVENFDLPEAFDLDAMIQDIEKLRHGNLVSRREYTFNNLTARPKLLTFQPAPVLIIEGLFVMHFKRLRSYFDLKVFIDANDLLKVKRRILRDQAERNYPVEDVLYRYENHVYPAYRDYIAPYRDIVDMVINNNKSFRASLDVLCGFIQVHTKRSFKHPDR